MLNRVTSYVLLEECSTGRGRILVDTYFDNFKLQTIVVYSGRTETAKMIAAGELLLSAGCLVDTDGIEYLDP